MKRKVKQYVLIFGAIVVALSMLSNATAVNNEPDNILDEAKEKLLIENDEIQELDDIYVDPNIHLTREHLSKLKSSVKHLDDSRIKQFMMEVIRIIDTKGEADSEDIKEIIEDYDITNIAGIHAGYISGLGPGQANPIPGVLRSCLLFFSKGGLLSWNAKYNGAPPGALIEVTINLRSYSYEHSGLAFCFVGCILNRMNIWGMKYQWSSFLIEGVAPLIIVAENSGNDNSQANPSSNPQSNPSSQSSSCGETQESQSSPLSI